MSKKYLNIVSVSSEIDPFSKTGGLADVARSLPKALNRLGHKVICVTPFYGQVIDPKAHNLKIFLEGVEIRIHGNNSVKVNYWAGDLSKGLLVYFIENDKYFSRKKEMKDIYGSAHENARFLLFDLAVLKLLLILKFQPDVIQCHDWHSALIPYLLKREFKGSESLSKTATVLTIHNAIFQFGHNWWEIPVSERYNGKNGLPLFNQPELENVNFLRRGILQADIINTVSETHAEEMLTRDKGQELHQLLKNRQDRFFGIINGIDDKQYNPSDDPGLKVNYNYTQIDRKRENKLFIQKRYGLSEDAEVPLIVMSSRITHQKGFELILEAFKILLRLDIQIIVMGDGDGDYIKELKKMNKQYPKKIAWVSWDQERDYETSLYAGGDMFLLPSNNEPCGVNQMKALRYGCIPIVRSIGGLKDTITNFDFIHRDGNGFTFRTYSPLSLYGAIVRALEYYKDKKIWNKLAQDGMKISFSWNLPAKLYVELFRKAMVVASGKKKSNGKKIKSI